MTLLDIQAKKFYPTDKYIFLILNINVTIKSLETVHFFKEINRLLLFINGTLN